VVGIDRVREAGRQKEGQVRVPRGSKIFVDNTRGLRFITRPQSRPDRDPDRTARIEFRPGRDADRVAMQTGRRRNANWVILAPNCMSLVPRNRGPPRAFAGPQSQPHSKMQQRSFLVARGADATVPDIEGQQPRHLLEPLAQHEHPLLLKAARSARADAFSGAGILA
jgi:hypothetical protein